MNVTEPLTLLGGISPGLSATLQYFGNPGSYVQVENEGLSVGVIAGAVSERNRCVPRRAQPPSSRPWARRRSSAC